MGRAGTIIQKPRNSRLKGSIQFFDVKRPAVAALRLETLARERDMVGAEEARLALEKEVERLLPMLADLKNP